MCKVGGRFVEGMGAVLEISPADSSNREMKSLLYCSFVSINTQQDIKITLLNLCKGEFYIQKVNNSFISKPLFEQLKLKRYFETKLQNALQGNIITWTVITIPYFVFHHWRDEFIYKVIFLLKSLMVMADENGTCEVTTKSIFRKCQLSRDLHLFALYYWWPSSGGEIFELQGGLLLGNSCCYGANNISYISVQNLWTSLELCEDHSEIIEIHCQVDAL